MALGVDYGRLCSVTVYGSNDVDKRRASACGAFPARGCRAAYVASLILRHSRGRRNTPNTKQASRSGRTGGVCSAVAAIAAFTRTLQQESQRAKR